jgi:hypothetical protein
VRNLAEKLVGGNDQKQLSTSMESRSLRDIYIISKEIIG